MRRRRVLFRRRPRGTQTRGRIDRGFNLVRVDPVPVARAQEPRGGVQAPQRDRHGLGRVGLRRRRLRSVRRSPAPRAGAGRSLGDDAPTQGEAAGQGARLPFRGHRAGHGARAPRRGMVRGGFSPRGHEAQAGGAQGTTRRQSRQARHRRALPGGATRFFARRRRRDNQRRRRVEGDAPRPRARGQEDDARGSEQHPGRHRVHAPGGRVRGGHPQAHPRHAADPRHCAHQRVEPPAAGVRGANQGAGRREARPAQALQPRAPA
mmetsp:Transcript_182120/g.443137  ORF Transcript_182120/g.443137 Transcript_182120/m.443137 type:complete len:263 (+) Transcript_182120:259-1047(+)